MSVLAALAEAGLQYPQPVAQLPVTPASGVQHPLLASTVTLIHIVHENMNKYREKTKLIGASQGKIGILFPEKGNEGQREENCLFGENLCIIINWCLFLSGVANVLCGSI